MAERKPWPGDESIIGSQWSLWMAEDDTIQANEITPTWGGGGPVAEVIDPNLPVVQFTEDETETLLKALAYVNAYFGSPPSPPTPGMTAQKKLEALYASE